MSMTAERTPAPTALLERADAWVAPDGTPVPSARSLVVEVLDATDPVRFARVVSGLVNNTAMALTEVVVAGVQAYPVPAPVVPRIERRRLTLTVRDASRALDQAVQDQVVHLITSAYRVVSVRRGA